MRNWWEECPHDLLSEEAKRIDKLGDFLRFGAVCKSWQAAAVMDNFQRPKLREQIPYLILAGEGDEREFYSITEHEVVAKITRPCFKGRRCTESLGWLLTVGTEGDMSLLNPITGFEIELPHHRTFPYDGGPLPSVDIMRMALSFGPDESSDFAVMVIGGTHNLGFWRPGDRAWNPIRRIKGPVRDITYFNGKFYVVEAKGLVSAFDLTGSDPGQGRLIADNELLAQTFSLFKISEMNLYIGEFSGELLIILRDSRQSDGAGEDIFYETYCFYIYRVDISSGRWEEIQSLGSKAVFVGHNETMLVVDTSEFCEFKADHIYYTTDAWHLWDQCIVSDPIKAGLDVGVYNLLTKEIEPFYHGDKAKLFNQISPALWFIYPKI